MRYRFALMSVAFAMIACLPSVAETGSARSGVLGSIEAASGSDATLQDVLVSALALQIERRNARFTALEPLGAPDSNRTSKGLRRAAELEAQYLLLGQYATASRRLTLTIDLYDAETGKKIGSASSSGRIGLSMDGVAADALNHLLAGLPLRPLPSQPDVQVPVGPPQVNKPEPGTGQEPPPPAVSVTAAPRRQLLSLAAGVAPFIPLGGNTYTQLGVIGTVSAVVRFPLGPGILGAGLLTGVSVVNASGSAASATLLLVPLGPDIRYSMNEGGFPGVVVHASAGPALMSVATSYEGTLSKPIPYLLAGMSIDLPFTPNLGLAFEAAWAGFFESTSLLLMALAPEVSLYARM